MILSISEAYFFTGESEVISISYISTVYLRYVLHGSILKKLAFFS